MVLAIIDHMNHQLFIESVDEQVIEEKYNGEEEDYIRDKYEFGEDELFSWDYITERVEVFGEEKNGFVDIHRNI